MNPSAEKLKKTTKTLASIKSLERFFWGRLSAGRRASTVAGAGSRPRHAEQGKELERGCDFGGAKGRF